MNGYHVIHCCQAMYMIMIYRTHMCESMTTTWCSNRCEADSVTVARYIIALYVMRKVDYKHAATSDATCDASYVPVTLLLNSTVAIGPIAEPAGR